MVQKRDRGIRRPWDQPRSHDSKLREAFKHLRRNDQRFSFGAACGIASCPYDSAHSLDGGTDGSAPLLSIFGGKITTYRRLAEAALQQLAPFFPDMGRPWTKDQPLPGGDIPHRDLVGYGRSLAALYPGLPSEYLDALLHRHGTRCTAVLGEAKTEADLGIHFGHTLYAVEVDYFVEDVLWRRTKCGLHLDSAQREAVAAYLRERYDYR